MPSLNSAELTRTLVRPAGLWREVLVTGQTGSTNTDLLAKARAGEPEGLVLVAEEQTAGRGRLGRQWLSAPGSGLTFSVLLRPDSVPAARLGWVPLLTGVAVVAAVRTVAGVAADLKWPNDVLVGHGKLAGVLAESCGKAIVVGVGLNVSHQSRDLPEPTATSLALHTAAPPARDRLLVAVLGELARWYLAWREQASPGDADACGLRAEYQRCSSTLGREVTVTLPGGGTLNGTAEGVDAAGRLEIRTADSLAGVSAGDVVYMR